MSLATALSLDKPLVLIDLETTGIKPSQCRIVQIGVIKIYPNGEETVWTTLVNPSETHYWHISEEATSIHGISDEDVAGELNFRTIGPILLKGIMGCYIGGYNVRFDLDCLDYSFDRIGAPFDPDDYEILDAFDIFRHFHPRDLTAAYKHFCGKELEGAHQADADIMATKEVLEAQIEQWPVTLSSVSSIHALLKKDRGNRIDRHGKFIWIDDVACVAFGKHEDKPLHQVPRDYLRWMVDDAEDFSPKAKRIAASALNGRFPERVK